MRCISPVDGSVFAERPALGESQALECAARARKAQRAWAARPLAERAQLTLAAVRMLCGQREETAEELAWMMGRPVRYGGEFGGVQERTEYMAGIAESALAPIIAESGGKFQRHVARVPQGVVFVIAPWNYPYLTAINTIAPALIAGNAVMLKHATQTLLAGERLAAAFVSAGVPADIFQNVFLTHEVAGNLIAARAFDFVNFTGSVAGGRAIERAAAGTFTSLGLELGGKDPAYVMEDADMEAAAAALTDAAMYNSGQCCCGIERIYACEQRYDELLQRMTALCEEYRLGNPLHADTTLGPMAAARFAAHARAQIEQAVAAGAVAHVKNRDGDDGGAYMAPQLLTNVTPEMPVMRDESFAPLACLVKVRDDDEAVAQMNDSDYGLTASLWSNDAKRALRVGERLETGTVFMNRADYVDPALCWTGCKNTGRGGALSEIGFHNLTRPMSFHLKKTAA